MNGCDLFCRVVDHFGDAGVAWRLAAELNARTGWPVTLWIDRPATLQRLVPGLPLGRPGTAHPGITVRHWDDAQADATARPAPVVLTTFGCRLPQRWLDRMKAMPRQPAWVQVDHLNLEPWGAQVHGRPSFQPATGLVEHYFIPGLHPGSGGLFREGDYDARRRRREHDQDGIDDLVRRLGVAPRQPDEHWVLLFCYRDAPVPALIEQLAWGTQHWRLLVPEGVAIEALEARLTRRASAGTMMRIGRLRIDVIPMVPQRLFDDLLRLVDIALVRGEDSLMRALWSGKPLVWQPYREADGGHQAKLAAFETLHAQGWDPAVAQSWRQLSQAWNGLPAPQPGPPAVAAAPGPARTGRRAPPVLAGWTDAVAALGAWQHAAAASSAALRPRATGFDELLAMIAAAA